MSATGGPTLKGWLLRDALLTLLLAAALTGLSSWHGNHKSLASMLLAPTIGFVAAYALCYVYHEWGHLLGARLAGARMPLSPYASPLIGTFDLRTHSRRQFLWLSWGGVLGYLLTLVLVLTLHRSAAVGLAGAGAAVGALAFNVQSLAVDLPQIWRVMAGADIARTSAEGASGAVILRRTWQSWSLLAFGLLLWHQPW